MGDPSFRVLTIRSAGTTAQPALYPLRSSNRGKIIDLDEPLDGKGLTDTYCRASGVTVSQIIDGTEQTILRASRLKMQVHVTAGRLALASNRYSRASALAVAGPGAGLDVTGVTRLRARLTESSAIVGHIRYPWIRSVSTWPRRWRFGRETLVIEYAMAPRIPMLLRLNLRLPQALTPALVAAEVCLRVVEYWQTHDSNAPPDLQKALDDLGLRAAADRVAFTAQPNRNKAVVYELPAWHPVTGAVPFERRPRRSRPGYKDDKAGEE